MKNVRFVSLVIVCLTYLVVKANAGITVSGFPVNGGVSLHDATVFVDGGDGDAALTAAQMLADDICRVTGSIIRVDSTRISGSPIIVGTLGRNKVIDNLVSKNKLDVSEIRNGWEQFVIRMVDNPVTGVDRAIVVAGCDPRGTAFGAVTLSEKIGVSPWYWWADVPVVRSEKLYAKADTVSKCPSVKYRGIFINDEDWGLKTWSAYNFEKELGDIGPKTYDKVCELIIRLKGNMLAPAMHSCTGAFYTHPESKRVAGKYGVLITTSHCEPLLFNNASKQEWDKERDGEWNFRDNKDAILSKLDSRVKEAAEFENVYTLAMRGLHDEGMRGNLTEEQKVEVLKDAITCERGILEKYIDKPLDEIPQIFVPYKEALDIYEMGLEVPDEVTLVWVDDNYGYIKRLSNPEEQKRSGRAGVYYHTSYLGAPHDYLWLNTTPPVLMYEEFKKAYVSGADRYWLLNVGDIKPAELGITLFFDMAMDIDEFDYDKANTHQAELLARLFGPEYEGELQWLLDEYYRLAWSRKPEFMGWEREWDTPEFTPLADTEFSFSNYNDAQNRLKDYKAISDKSRDIMERLPENQRAAFFEMIGYPAMASCQMNNKFLMAQLNHELAAQGKMEEANWAALRAREAYDSINALNAEYNGMLDGKWNHMMALAPGWCAKYQNMPEVVYDENKGVMPVDVAPSSEGDVYNDFLVIDLSEYRRNDAECDSPKRSVRLIEGIGYDWQALQLGEAHEPSSRYVTEPIVSFDLGSIDADSVTVTVWSLPFFPIYKGREVGYGISVDGDEPSYTGNLQPKEYDPRWKTNVLRNSEVVTFKKKLKRGQSDHALGIHCWEPGTIIQRIVVDWGGLKPTYVGPSVKK